MSGPEATNTPCTSEAETTTSNRSCQMPDVAACASNSTVDLSPAHALRFPLSTESPFIVRDWVMGGELSAGPYYNGGGSINEVCTWIGRVAMGAKTGWTRQMTMAAG